jgi:hypothetical protein
MSVQVNKKGDLVVVIPKQDSFNAVDELELRRTAIYSALTEHNNKEFVGSDAHYGLVEILKDLDPSPEQWSKILQTEIKE